MKKIAIKKRLVLDPLAHLGICPEDFLVCDCVRRDTSTECLNNCTIKKFEEAMDSRAGRGGMCWWTRFGYIQADQP